MSGALGRVSRGILAAVGLALVGFVLSPWLAVAVLWGIVLADRRFPLLEVVLLPLFLLGLVLLMLLAGL